MAQVNLLLVEENDLIAREITKQLIKSVYTVCAVAKDGETAITLAAKKQPDLVLVNIGLKGGINGIEIAGQIRTRFSLPAVYFTDGADAEVDDGVKRNEPVGYIVNPFDIGSLKNGIDTALKQHRVEDKEDSREKLETVLENAGEICHELNQPLMAISGLSELLLFTMDQSNPAYEKITKIQSQVQRMSAITQKLMGLTRDERMVSG